MSTTTDEQIAKWREWNRERWDAVETFKARELAAMTDDRARQIIERLKVFAPVPSDPLNGMGLVKQQAIFQKNKS